MPERSVRLVVFDMAGTTIRDDDAVNRCFRAALAAAGVAVDAAAVNAVMGLPKLEAVRRLLASPTAAQLESPSAVAIHADFVDRMCAHYRNDPSVAAVDGAVEVFRALRAAGVKVTLDTGFDRAIADTVLARLGWSAGGAIDATITSDEVAHGRPHADMILALMRTVGVPDPARVAKVGDTPADLLSGAAAGCGWNIGVTAGTHTRRALEAYPHTHLIDDIRQLCRLLAV